MLIIPAIDIKDGKCVRLQQGDYNKVSVYFESIVDTALYWAKLGANRIHLVDLDGALKGSPANKAEIIKLVKSLKNYTNKKDKKHYIHTQLGGGIRNLKTIESYLKLGIDYLILGTAAIKNPEFIRRACQEFPGHIIAGIDAKNDKIAINAWTKTTKYSAIEKAKEFASYGVNEVIYTDISRDGMLTGVNIEQTIQLAKKTKIKVIASGGVSSISDIKKLYQQRHYGICGVITGKAIYEKKLDFVEALKITT